MDTNKGASFRAFAQEYVEEAAKTRKATGAPPLLPGQSAAITSACGDPGGGLYSAKDLPDKPPKVAAGNDEEEEDDKDEGPGTTLVEHMLAADRVRARAAREAGAAVVPVPGSSGNGTAAGGFAAIGHGVDVVTGRRRGRIMPAVTYDRNKTYFDPYTLRVLTLPDAVDAAVMCTSCFEETMTDWSSGALVAQYRLAKSGWSAGLSVGGAAVDASFASARHWFETASDSFKLGAWTLTRDVQNYRLLYDGGEVDPAFLALVASMPADDPLDPAWDKVFEAYGTHFTGELGMGATCNLTPTYSRADTKGFSASYVHGQLDIAVAQITEDMGVPGDYAFPALEKDRGKGVDPKFAHAIKHKTATCRGGDPKLREAKQYFAWLNSTAYEPAPIPRAARLVPNYVLVAGTDPALGAAFKAATEHYINKQAKL